MPRPVNSRRRRRGAGSGGPRRPTPTADTAARLRSLIQQGHVTSVALDASDDLAAAATSLHRLGTLTSGMWRALSRELATAAERLDRQTDEHLADLQQRARALGVDPDAVLAAGSAAAHLEEHRETLETLLPKLDADVRRLAAPELLLGFSVDEQVLLGGEADQDTDAEADAAAGSDAGDASDAVRPAIRIWLFVWPAPLTPVGVTIVPNLEQIQAPHRTPDPDVALDTILDVQVEGDDAAREALMAASGLSGERLFSTLSTLGLTCWSAHQLDELGEEDDEDEDEDVDVDVDADAAEDEA